MIKTRKELQGYILADFLANEGKGSLQSDFTFKMKIRKLLGWWTEFENVRHYMRILRHYEYYLNNSSKSIKNRILCKYYFHKWHRLSMNMKVHIPANVVGKGFRISHYVGGVVVNCYSMGDFCSVGSGVVIGNKDSDENRATIGNHVKFTLGAKVIGKILIGDNVIVAPNTVVIKDIESNTVVSGVPAKVIKKL